MSLSKTLEEIKAVTPLANEVLDDNFVETLNARRGRKAQSIERLKQLKREYREKLRQTAAFIFVVGDKRDVLVSTATEQFKCFSTDPDTFYKDLTDLITKASDFKRETSTGLHDILGRHLEEKMGDLDVVQYNQLIFNEKYRRAITDKEDLLSWVKTVVNSRVGAEIVAIQAIESLVEPAIKAEHSKKITPILLPTGDEKFALEVMNGLSKLTSRVFLVSAGKPPKSVKGYEGLVVVKDPTSESVQQALKSISDSLINDRVN